jgi:hypothetical protein
VTIKRLSVLLATGALLLLGFSDCMSALTLDHQSMQCCGSMPCTPANHNHDCCKNMTPGTPNMLPPGHVSLHPPIVASVEYSPMLAMVWNTRAPVPLAFVETQQHSPPNLYTLHASLLI